ncbi:MAG: class I SAM-dependent methyltransferase [Xanthobacteraceae bacterium]|nr:class I SAM-dependent methyltransferase [Xanthobacteraceae bacterium]
MSLHRIREQAFRDKDTPFEQAALDIESSALVRLPEALRRRTGGLLRWCGRKLDDMLRPDMRAILLARSVSGISMLHIDSRLALDQCATKCRGAILEIGAFVGGGTITMASAMKRSGNEAPVLAIEVGGSSENPLMPSNDIIRDLKSNLDRYGVVDRVTIIEGWSNEVLGDVERLLAGHKIGLLVIDADGEVIRDICIYRKVLQRGAAIVIDDYASNEPNIKSPVVRAAVEKLVSDGLLRKTKILPWGTWFGTYRG